MENNPIMVDWEPVDLHVGHFQQREAGIVGSLIVTKKLL